MLLNKLKDASCGIFIKVAVDDLAYLFPFEHGGEREHGERKATVAGLRGARVIEDDHAGTSTVKIWNCEGYGDLSALHEEDVKPIGARRRA